MAQQPNRPFESLEWYRDAARRGFEEDGGSGDLVQRATSFGVLRTHVSVFAVAVVSLLAINLLRTPEDVWADRWILAWTMLLLVHAVGIGIVWGLQQWNAEDSDEALRLDTSRWRQSPMFGWGASSGTPSDAQDVSFRVAGPAEREAAPPPPAPGWNGWNADVPAPPESERASWREASATAWLDRRSRAGKQAPPEPASDPKPDPEA